VECIDAFADRVPEQWREHGGIFIPLYQREALWLGFGGVSWKPNAVQVGVGGINAVSGTAWGDKLSADPQNYLVTPYQPWLDGINIGDGVIRQFVAMPLGKGYTIEAQLRGDEEVGGIQLRIFEPKPGRFPDHPPQDQPQLEKDQHALASVAIGMGLGAGGKMQQRIYPDPYTFDAWDESNSSDVFVHLVNSLHYRELTGRRPPRTPVSARAYTKYGLPWFDLYDEGYGAVPPTKKLASVKSIHTIDRDRQVREKSATEEVVHIEPSQRRKIRLP